MTLFLFGMLAGIALSGLVLLALIWFGSVEGARLPEREE